ncbi:MAG: hypothetical protein ACFE8U_17345 [Candidatus Hermodarchaeota archaeon]
MNLKSKWNEMESRRIEQYSASKKSRPILVSLISLIGMSVSILVIFIGIFFIIFMRNYYGEVNTFIGGGIVIMSGVILFALEYGLWNLDRLAWLITVILHGLFTLGYLFNFQGILLALQTGTWSLLLPPIVIIGLFFYFISVREEF